MSSTRSRRVIPIVAYATVFGAAVVLTLPGIGLPWWVHTDPDAVYNGSSLNILLGNHTSYLDHPGLPTQDALALGYGAWYLVDRHRGATTDREAWVSARMLDFDSARWLYRGWAVFLWAGGAVLVAILMGRLFRHWSWGVAGAGLYLATPGLRDLSHLLRPDALLAALCVAVAYNVILGFEGRSAARYLMAAFLFGLAMTVKIAALFAVIPLVVAAAWRPPGRGWEARVAVRTRIAFRRHALWLVPAVAIWAYLCIVINRERLPILTNDGQRSVAWNGLALIGGYALATLVSQWLRIPWARRIFSPLVLCLVVAFVVGVALPASLIVDDGLQAVVAATESISGGRVNANIPLFDQWDTSRFLHYPYNAATLVFALALAAAVAGVRRKVYWPAVLLTGAAPLALAAAARFNYDYYYAPAYALCIPGALWLVRDPGRRVVTPAAVAVVVLLLGQLVIHRPSLPEFDVEVNRAAQQLADRELEPGEVALVAGGGISLEDLQFKVVEAWVDFQPDFPYRFVAAAALGDALERHLQPKLVVGEVDALPPVGETVETTLDGQGPFTIRRLPEVWGPDGRFGVAEILAYPQPG